MQDSTRSKNAKKGEHSFEFDLEEARKCEKERKTKQKIEEMDRSKEQSVILKMEKGG
jgi:hypothetical protein